jgi:hypothetical protein
MNWSDLLDALILGLVMMLVCSARVIGAPLNRTFLAALRHHLPKPAELLSNLSIVLLFLAVFLWWDILIH